MRGPRGPWFSKPWRRWSGRRLRPTSCWGNPDGIKSRLLVTHDRRTDVVSRHPLEGAASWSTGGEGGPGGVERGTFVVARNPDPESKLPYLLSLPVSGGLLLKARRQLASLRPCVLPPSGNGLAGGARDHRAGANVGLPAPGTCGRPGAGPPPAGSLTVSSPRSGDGPPSSGRHRRRPVPPAPVPGSPASEQLPTSPSWWTPGSAIRTASPSAGRDRAGSPVRR